MSAISVAMTCLFMLLLFSFNINMVTSGRIGDLSTKSHGVSGTLHTLDEKTLFIQSFTYDGKNCGMENFSSMRGATVPAPL